MEIERLHTSYNFVTSEDIVVFCGTEIRKCNPVLFETVNNCRPHFLTRVLQNVKTNVLGWCLNEATEGLRTNSQFKAILSMTEITKQSLLTRLHMSYWNSVKEQFSCYHSSQYSLLVSWWILSQPGSIVYIGEIDCIYFFLLRVFLNSQFPLFPLSFSLSNITLTTGRWFMFVFKSTIELVSDDRHL